MIKIYCYPDCYKYTIFLYEKNKLIRTYYINNGYVSFNIKSGIYKMYVYSNCLNANNHFISLIHKDGIDSDIYINQNSFITFYLFDRKYENIKIMEAKLWLK